MPTTATVEDIQATFKGFGRVSPCPCPAASRLLCIVLCSTACRQLVAP